VIAVTCRNGEHFTIDPAEIERAESVPDVVLHMVGGRTYVLAMDMDELLRTIRDSRAELVVAQRRMGEAPADPDAPGRTADLRVERRERSRNGDSPGSPADRRPVD
jgi:uncharacterized protein YlzI (FlbEa/FlbD family)